MNANQTQPPAGTEGYEATRQELQALNDRVQTLIDKIEASTRGCSDSSQIQPIPGQFWPEQHGFYAGIMPALDGQPAYHLILDPADLIAADGSAEHEWGEYGKKIAGADSLTDGLANTKALVAANQAFVSSMHSAPSVHLGCGAPYIPSKREMALLVATCSEHMTAGELYWTSSQCSANDAWYQSFNLGLSHWNSKTNSVRVRPVRRLFL